MRTLLQLIGREEKADSLRQQSAKDQRTGGRDEDDTPCNFGFAIARRIANLAVQQSLGLLPEWRFGAVTGDRTDIGSDGPRVGRERPTILGARGGE